MILVLHAFTLSVQWENRLLNESFHLEANLSLKVLTKLEAVLEWQEWVSLWVGSWREKKRSAGGAYP